MEERGCQEKWVVYGNSAFCAKELTIHPGRTVTIPDAAAVEGVQIANTSETDDIVMLKHFGPDNADAVGLLKQYG
jgi:hypothetical protein